jgi:hypothetical protein
MKQAVIGASFFVVFLALPALGQIPDTTSAWRYLPLEVGNVWEYESWYQYGGDPELTGYTRFAVVGDTTMPTQMGDDPPAERHYFKVLRERLHPDGGTWDTGVIWLRFDTTRATVRGSYGVTDDPGTALGPAGRCPLNAAFSGVINTSYVTCETPPEFEEPMQARVGGGYDQPVPIEEGLEATVKSLSTGYLTSSVTRYAADMGMISTWASESSSWWSTLVYARVGGVEYGIRIPVAAEGAPTDLAVALTVFPNPSREVSTIGFTLDAPQRVTITVFDVLGRRVLADDLGVQPAGETGHRLDLTALPAGVYIVRLAGNAGATATVQIVRQ